MGRRRRRLTLTLAAVLAIAIALRAGPLWQSPLPFNPDGIIHAVHAQSTVLAGELPLATIATDDLLFTAFIATLAEVTGLPPMLVAQPVIAVVGAVPVLVAAAVARRIAQYNGWRRSRILLVAILAGALLAVEGLYLHRSMPVDEQTLGLLFVPLVVLAGAIAVDTGERRWIAITGVLLLALPATHNLDSLVAAIALTGLASLAVASGRRTAASRAIVLGVVAWVTLVGYTALVAGLTPARVLQSDRLTSVPGLVLAWIVLLVIVLPWFLGTRSRTQRTLGVGVIASLCSLVFVNAVVPIFPGTGTTPPLLALGLFPLVGLALVACWAVPTASVGTEGRAMAALVAAVVALVGVALTATLTPEYKNLVYRAQTFVHLPILTGTALGVVGIAARRWRSPTSFRTGVSVLLAASLVAAAVSIPIAFSGLALIPYKGVTTPAEMETASFAETHVQGNWTGDNHVVRITWGQEDALNASRNEPTVGAVSDWIAGGGPPPNCPTVVQASWSTVGAQLFPRMPERLDRRERVAFTQSNHVVYATAGTQDSLSIVVPRRSSSVC